MLLTSKLQNTIFVSLENKDYPGHIVSTTAAYLIQKGRDDMQEVLKKGSRKAFSVNLERKCFETKQTTSSPKNVLDTALKKFSFTIDVIKYFNYSQAKFKISITTKFMMQVSVSKVNYTISYTLKFITY